ncbi:SpoIIE family protein phosphatase [Streptomyces sp. AK02-04a]|uniref:ATP-binding SpoIIE family protein phosphatase n=1 Tax=Streptomyces sp. AK02-04a TaxID=3028649 RepID=UPI0029A95941|nr:SpoIIE family protein phosphatase [Streptomyces sp. AK02-04a]MDX3761891.1 SpoIIE family protein phosphatase [Streptomyces sp. AK02-04a]
MPDNDVLALIDEGGRVVEWGRLAEELFGWSAEEAVGQSLSVLMREAATSDDWRRKRFSETAAVLVKPVLQGTSMVWQVTVTEDAVSRQDKAVLQTVFSQSAVELYVLDDQLRVVRMSPAAHGLQEGTVKHLVGRYFTEVYAFERPEDEAAVAQGVLESGEPVVDRLLRDVEVPGRPGRRIFTVSYFRLEDSHGDVLGLVVPVVDVTERENARNRLALLDTVRAQVGHRMHVMDVCRELVEAVVPSFAGSADVEVVEDVVRGEDPPPTPAPQDLPLRRTASRSLICGAPVATVRPLPPATPYSRILSDLRPRLVAIEEDSSWLAADPIRAAVIKRSGAHCMIVAPLTLHGQALGVVSFYRHQNEAPFEEDDVMVASAMCAHAALCLNNAHRYMREWIIASTAQRRLLPRPPATRTTVEISPLHLPSPQGGGAWYDAIPLPGVRTALIVGDVARQGIAAAITMGLLRTAVHTLAALDLPPDELLARLSDTAARLLSARAAMPPMDPLDREPLTARCAIAIYDPVELTCTIARAGLPEPVAVFPDGTSAVLPASPGPLLTGTDNAPFPATTVGLPEGSTLAMGTAALADEVLAPSGPLHPLLDGASTRPLSELRDTIASAFRGSPSNETLLLLARTKALPADHVLTRSLPDHPKAASLAREATRHQLELWGVDEETASTTELIVSEFVGNAIRYGAPPLRLRLILEQKLTCEVSDAATSAPHVKHARTIDETGRGLFIIAALADHWGARFQEQGKSVWAEQSMAHPLSLK